MLMRTSRRRWYCIQCRPRQENRAFENLERQGFCCYLPGINAAKVRDGHRVEAHEPLFPGYVFVSLDSVTDNWHPVRSTRGVSQIVSFSGQPLPVQDELIEEIRTRLAGPELHKPYLAPGERVRITEGAFSQLEAIFLAEQGEERVVLLLTLLQQDQALSFPISSVRKMA